MKDSEARFRTLIEQSPLAIQIVTPDGRTQSVNPAWEKLWGVPLEALARYNLLHDQQLVEKGVMPGIHRAFAGQASTTSVIEYDRAATPEVEGQQGKLYVRTIAFPSKTAEGQLSEVVLMQEDVTEQALSEQALRQSEEKLRTILDGVDAYIYLKDTEGRYLFANAAVRKLWRTEMADLIGFGDEKFFDADTAANIRRHDSRVLVDGETLRAEETNTVALTGQTSTYLTVKLPLRREDGSIYAL